MVHGRRGPAPQTAKRKQFAGLIGRGVPNAEACRIVGIHWRTGTRWRHGRTITSCTGKSLHYAPVINTRKTEISPRYLSGGSVGPTPATISRELSRNADPVPGS